MEKELTSQISTAHRYFGVYKFSQLLPNPDIILRRLGKSSVSAYRELLIDPIVSGAVRRRKASVAGLNYRLDSDLSDKQQAVIDQIFDSLDIYGAPYSLA